MAYVHSHDSGSRSAVSVVENVYGLNRIPCLTGCFALRKAAGG